MSARLSSFSSVLQCCLLCIAAVEVFATAPTIANTTFFHSAALQTTSPMRGLILNISSVPTSQTTANLTMTTVTPHEISTTVMVTLNRTSSPSTTAANSSATTNSSNSTQASNTSYTSSTTVMTNASFMTTLYLRVDNATTVKNLMNRAITSEEVFFVIVILACLLVAVCITAIICLCILRAISKNNNSRALTPRAKEPSFGKNNEDQHPEPSKTSPDNSSFADVSVNLNDPYDDTPGIPPGLAFQPPSRSYSIDNYGASFGSSVGRVSESVTSYPSHAVEGYDDGLSEGPSAATAYSGTSVPHSAAATVDSGAPLPLSLPDSAPAPPPPPPPSLTDADSEGVDISFEPPVHTVLDVQNVSTGVHPHRDDTQLPGYP